MKENKFEAGFDLVTRSLIIVFMVYTIRSKKLKTLIKFYRKYRPLKGYQMCRFEPSCSCYMEQAVEKYGFRGFLMGCWRIVRCNPLNKHSGSDPVR
jgi:putative component of membrane protein insertase Oxa1/YidC/SpoIIIJ protein YidD